MQREIFVSYSQPDAECAFELVERLEAHHMTCWIAPRDIAPAADWAAAIIDAIAGARTMILVFSSSTNESAQVRREVERAVHKQVPILPFRIENVLPSKSLEYFLSSQHWLDAFTTPRETHYARLCTYLKTQYGLTRASPVAEPALHGIDLRPVEITLARAIGPLAAYLVRQAAARASSVDDFCARLAPELETESERHAFEHSCRLLLTTRSAS